MKRIRLEGLSSDGIEGRLFDPDTGESITNIKNILIQWDVGEPKNRVSVTFLQEEDADGVVSVMQNWWRAVDMPPLTVTLERIE